MKNLVWILVLMASLSFAQKERVQIQGVLNSTSNEPLEGVAVFNQASLEGTVTNKEGKFFIHAREQDKLAFKAIQFENFSLTITSKVMKEKKIIISLSEGVNQLDEVVIDDNLMKIKVKKTTYVDPKIDEVSDFNVKTPAVDRMSNTFSDRIRQPEEYAIRNEAFMQSQPRFNMVNIVGALAAMAVGTAIQSLETSIDAGPTPTKKEFDVYVLKNKYSTDYLLSYLQIPSSDLYEFMYFAKDAGLDESYFTPEKELDLLQFLSNQVVLFKQKKNYSNNQEDFSPSIKVKSDEK